MKKLISFITVFVLLAALCIPALATSGGELDYVTDAAAILTPSELRDLEEKAQLVSDQYQCDVYIITLDDYTNYGSGSIYDVAKAIYTEYSLGWGAEKSGVLLLLSMEERNYTLIAYGYGNTAFTDYGKTKLADEFLDNFKDDDWSGGFEDYIDKSASMLDAAENGQALDVDSDPTLGSVGVLISVVLGCVISLIVCLILRMRMKSVFIKTEANAYIPADSVNFTVREDHFTHATESRVKIERDSGNGGTTVDGDGFSGQSGNF